MSQRFDCTSCDQDMRLPHLAPRELRALLTVAREERRCHGPNICKPRCKVCRAFKHLDRLLASDTTGDTGHE